MSRRSLLATATSVLLLLDQSGISWAGSPTTALPRPITTTGAFAFAGPNAGHNPYGVSTALSTALSVGSVADAASLNANPIGQGQIAIGSKKGPLIQFNSAPTVQTAIGAAVSIGGSASAAAINTNDTAQTSQH